MVHTYKDVASNAVLIKEMGLFIIINVFFLQLLSCINLLTTSRGHEKQQESVDEGSRGIARCLIGGLQ